MELKKRALFINPPIYDFALYDLFLKPFGLLRCAEWLRKFGWEIDYINGLDYKDPDSIEIFGKVKREKNGTGKFFRSPVKLDLNLKRINRRFARYGVEKKSFKNLINNKKRPDLVFVGSGMTYWYLGVKETIKNINSIFPGVPVLVGGPYASLMPSHCLKVSKADYVIKGDIWPGIKDIFNELSLPCPDEAPGMDVLMDKNTWSEAAVLRLNSGCPMSCSYCASREVSGDFKAGNPSVSFNLFEKIRNTYSTKNFAFYDDALLVNKKDVFIPFLEKIIKEKHNVNFYLPNAVHINYLDLYTAKLMVKAGFKEIRLGFESSSQEFHEENDGKFLISKFKSFIDILKEAGFKSNKIAVYILTGLPGQLASEVAKSIEYAKTFKVKIYLAQYSPVPGTIFWEESVKKSSLPLETEPLYHNNTFFPMEWDGFTMEELSKLKLDLQEYNHLI